MEVLCTPPPPDGWLDWMPSPSPVVAIAPPPVDSVAGWYVHLTVIVVFYARVNKLKTITISCYSFGLFVRLFPLISYARAIFLKTILASLKEIAYEFLMTSYLDQICYLMFVQNSAVSSSAHKMLFQATLIVSDNFRWR